MESAQKNRLDRTDQMRKGHSLLTSGEAVVLYLSSWLCLVATILPVTTSAWLVAVSFRALLLGTVGLVFAAWLRNKSVSRRLLNALTLAGTGIVFSFDLSMLGLRLDDLMHPNIRLLLSLSTYDGVRLVMAGIMTLYAFRCFALLEGRDAAAALIAGFSLFVLCLPLQRSVLLVAYFIPYAVGALVVLTIARTEELRRSNRVLTLPTEDEKSSQRTVARTIVSMGVWVMMLSLFLSYLLTSAVHPSSWVLRFQTNIAEVIARWLVPGILISAPSYPYLSLRSHPWPPSKRVIFRVESDVPGYWRAMSYDKYYGTTWRRTLKPAPAPSAEILDLPRTDAVRDDENVRYLLVMQTYYLETNYTGALPALFEPVRLESSLRRLKTDNAGSLFCLQELLPDSSYVIWSRVKVLTPKILRKESSFPSSPSSSAHPSHQDRLLQPYLQIPKELSHRMRMLASRLTKHATTTWEKVETLRDYLSRGFTYSLEPPIPPPGQDALDFFVFRSRTGYCVHFATAMAIMCRTIGIPSRLVVGFRTGGFDLRTFSYVVRERDSHAWTEVFLPRLGWVAIEPSPEFSIPPPKPRAKTALNRPLPATWFEGLLAALEGIWQEHGKWVLLGIFAAVFAAAAAAFLRSLRRRRQRIMAKMVTSVTLATLSPDLLRLLSIFNKACRLLRRHFRPRHIAETMLEYASAVRSALPQSPAAEDFQCITQMANRGLYSGQPIEPAHEKAMREKLTHLQRNLRAGKKNTRNEQGMK